MVSVTVRLLSVTTPAATVALSWYVMARVAFVFLGIPVTTSSAVVPSVTAPRDVAPGGAANVARSVTFAGIAALSCAVTLYVRFGVGVVTVYVVLPFVTDVGCDPATAALILSNPGFPETAMVCAPTALPATTSSADERTNTFKWVNSSFKSLYVRSIGWRRDDSLLLKE